MAEAHVQHLQKLVPAFDNLYNAMPRAAEKADGPGVPGQCGAARGAIASWYELDSDSKIRPVCASAQAPDFLDGHRLSSLYRGATLPPKILGESARALIPS